MEFERLISQNFNILLAFLLFLIGWYFGRRAEAKHLQSLAIREKKLQHIQVSSERHLPLMSEHSVLVVGNVVIAQDRFKMIVANLLSLFGKNLTVYESLLDRAYREAMIRAKEQAAQQNCQHIYGIRLESGDLDGGFEVIAYGTAVRHKRANLLK